MLRGADPPALAYYLAALREAFEETGILVALREDGSAPPTAARDGSVDGLREEVMADAIPFSDALHRLGCRIDAAAIEYIAHWITPEAEPRRYDTRFFAARVPEGTEPIVDPREMTDAVWLTPAAALDRLERGSMPMVFPTIKTLEQLAPFAQATEALRVIGAQPVRTILPRLVITPTGVGLRLDDED